ncbi:MAG: hypothetical protein ABL909_07785 [Sphingopyxis sp.]
MLISLFLLAAQVENPTTVNNQSLGTAEDFHTAGPARVCISNVSIDLLGGEHAYLQYSGIHRGIVRVLGAEGFVDVTLGDSWRYDREEGELVYRRGRSRYYRVRRGGEWKYGLFTPTDYSDGVRELSADISGTAILGNEMDLPMVRRITYSDSTPTGCVRHYNYGWDVILGDAPLEEPVQ